MAALVVLALGCTVPMHAAGILEPPNARLARQVSAASLPPGFEDSIEQDAGSEGREQSGTVAGETFMDRSEAPFAGPLFRFGVVADVQYADKPDAGQRHYRGALAEIESAVAAFNREPLAFVANLGDLIDGNGPESETDLDRVLEVFGRLRVPVRHVVGNHCLEVTRPRLEAKLGLKSTWYSFRRAGWRFVVLDGMDVSLKAPPDSPGRAAAVRWIEQHPKAPTYNGALGPRQLEWFRAQLQSARRAGDQVIVFCHHPVLPASSDRNHVLWNHETVWEILSENGPVAAWFSGHDHRGGYAARQGTHCVTFPGLVEAPAGRGAQAVVEVWPDRLVIQGMGMVPSRVLSRSWAAQPFLRLRETTLDYHGADAEFTNLTEFRMGWFGPTNLDDPLTGGMWWAANLAVREANAAGMAHGNARTGLTNSASAPKPFRLVPRWAANPWGTGVADLARMVYEEQPLALLGSVDSAATHLAEQIVAKAQLPLVSPVATDPSVTLAGVSWMFACAPSDAVVAQVLVDDILACLEDRAPDRRRNAHDPGSSGNEAADKADKGTASGPVRSPSVSGGDAGLALLAATDHESRMVAREVLRELSRRGRPPAFRFDVPTGARAIDRQLSALETARPQAVAIVAGPEDAARLVRAVRERLPGSGPGRETAGSGSSFCLVFGSQAMARTRFRELAGPAAEGVRFPILFAPVAGDPEAARFAGRSLAECGQPPDYTAALAYDATRLLIEAINRAGPSRARIREALARLSPWQGIAGPIAFDGTGQNTRRNVGMGRISGGSIEVIRSDDPEDTAGVSP